MAPRKPSIDPVRWQPPPVDPLPDLPSAELTVIGLPGHAPEDVVVDGDGAIWTGGARAFAGQPELRQPPTRRLSEDERRSVGRR